MADTDRRFRLVNDYAGSRGFLSGFPNFHQADYGAGLVYGVHLLTSAVAEWRDVPRTTYGVFRIEDVPGLFRAANDYASHQGYAGAFPNCHQADHGAGVVYGTILIKPGAAQWQDVPRADLGSPPIDDVARMMTAANDWAVAHGFAAGFPTFHQSDYGSGVVYGLILFPIGNTEWRDVLVDDLFFAQPQDERTLVVLCRFRDGTGGLGPAPAAVDFYRDFFFGHGNSGLRDYFADVTHGRVNLVGDVVGWLDIGHTVAEHTAKQHQAQRIQAFYWGLDAARAAGIDVDDYPRQVVIIDQDTDWGGVSIGRSMILPHTATTTWSHSRTAHEFGHVLGLDDAFRTSLAADGTRADERYQDIHCIMSYATRGSRAPLSVLGRMMEAGPGLNGVYTHRLGGIPLSRLHTTTPFAPADTVDLAALGHIREEGALLIKVPPTLFRPATHWIELHAKSGWDRFIPESRVAVHETRAGDGGAYEVMVGARQDVRAGQPALVTLDGTLAVHVRSITGATARVRVWELGAPGVNELRIRRITTHALAQERVVIRSDRLEPVSLAGWVLRDEADHEDSAPWTFRFPDVTLQPGDDLTVWTRDGDPDAANLFWGRRLSVWNDDRDAAVLVDPAGTVVSRLAW